MMPAMVSPFRTTEAITANSGSPAAKFAVQLPAKAPEQNWVPLLVLWPGGRGDAAAAQAAVRTLGADAARAGFVAVAPVCDGDALSDTAAALLFAELRRTFRVAQGGMHAAARNEFARATAFVLTHRHQFQSFTALAAASDAELAGLRRLTARRVHVLADDDAAARQQHFAALHVARELPGAGFHELTNSPFTCWESRISRRARTNQASHASPPAWYIA